MTEDGAVHKIICFARGYKPCMFSQKVRVVRCDEGFFLWQLPFTAGCSTAYCTADMQEELIKLERGW